jgi:hypothetical protein
MTLTAAKQQGQQQSSSIDSMHKEMFLSMYQFASERRGAGGIDASA